MILEVSWDNLWTLSFGLSHLHGHGSWLLCEVALSCNEYGEPATSYRWTDWLWAITSEVQDVRGKITDPFRGIYRIQLELIKKNLWMSKCTRLHSWKTLGSAQKSSRTLLSGPMGNKCLFSLKYAMVSGGLNQTYCKSLTGILVTSGASNDNVQEKLEGVFQGHRNNKVF